MKSNRFRINKRQSVITVGFLMMCVLATSCSGGTSSNVSSGGNSTNNTTSLPLLSDYIAEQCSGISDSLLFTQCRARAVREYGELSEEYRNSL